MRPCKFYPRKRFQYWREHEDGPDTLVADYQVGGEYICTTEPRHDALAAKLPEWKQDKWIDVVPLAPGEQLQTVTVTAEAD